MRRWVLDREALARRNQRLAALRHQPTAKQRLRNSALRLVAKAPISPQRAKSNRLLIIRPDHLGDMLLTTPAIQAIKRGRPEFSIHVLCGPWCAELLANFDEIDQALTLPFPGFRRGGSGRVNPWKLALQSAGKLRRIGYDSAIIMRPDHWWGALLAKLAGIGQRIGYDLPGVAPFLTDSRQLEHQHVVEQNLRLAEMLTVESPDDSIKLEFPLQDADRDFINLRLAEWQIASDKPLICIHPGSGAPSKLWSNEKWAAAADALAREYDAAVVLTGTAGEAAIAYDIAAKMSTAAIHAGSTSLGQLAALYRRSLAVLGPDSGAMHIAAAVGAPTVTLFGPADPIAFAPWGDSGRHRVVVSDIACRPCRILEWRDDAMENHPCVREITVGQVVGALRAASGDGWIICHRGSRKH